MQFFGKIKTKRISKEFKVHFLISKSSKTDTKRQNVKVIEININAK